MRSLIPVAFSICTTFALRAPAQTVRVLGARTLAHDRGQDLRGYSVAPSHALTVRASGPGVLSVRARALGDSGEIEITAVRDGQARSVTRRPLPPSAGGKLGGAQLSGAATVELAVPAGAHRYEISVSAAAFLQIGPSARPDAQWAAAPEEPLAPPAAAPLVLSPAPPAPAEAPGARIVEARADAAPAPGGTSEVSAVVTPEKGDRFKGFGVALELALVLPNGQASNVVQSGSALPTGSYSPSFAGSLEVSYAPSFGGWHDLSFVASGGYYPLSGNGGRSLPADPDFGTYSWNWNATTIPITLGLAYRLPIALPIPLHFSLHAGGLGAYTTFDSSYAQNGGAPVADAPQSAWAWGFYAGAEGSYDLGPGEILLVAHYMSARTDLGFQKVYSGQPWNATPGDIEGTNIQVGYRFRIF